MITKLENKKSKIKIDLIFNYFSLIFLGLSGIGLNIFIGVYYDASTLGVFNQVLAVYLVSSIIGSSGINFSVLKLIAQYQYDKNQVSAIIKGAFIPSFFTSLFATLIFFKLSHSISNIFSSELVELGMKTITPAVFFFSMNKIMLLGVINGLDRMKSFGIYQSLRYLLIFSSLLLCIKFSVSGENLSIIFFYSEFILFLLLFFDISYNFRWWRSNDWFKWSKKHIPFGLKSIFSTLFLEINTRIDVLMIAIFLTDQEVGIYSLAAFFAEGFLQLLVVIQNNINPLIANLFFNKKLKDLELFLKKVRNLSYKYILAIGLISVMIFPSLLEIVTNKPVFKTSFLPFSIIMFGIILISGYLPFQNILILFNKPILQSTQILFVSLINIIFNSLLIPIIGLNGAAISTSLANISSIFILKYYLYSKFKIAI